jgi:(p)ppGpp synthase/HD superfamily hydrolase
MRKQFIKGGDRDYLYICATMDHQLSVYKARDFAMAKHGDQKYGIYPYEVHLGNVVTVLMRFGVFPDSEAHYQLLAAAWLHDVLEDTPVTYAEMEAEFGSVIAQMVFCVTDEEGVNRKERKAKTYIKLAKDPDAVIIKLADRIANTEFCLIHDNESLFGMYKKEQPGFQEALSPAVRPGVAENMMEYLNGLFGN